MGPQWYTWMDGSHLSSGSLFNIFDPQPWHVELGVPVSTCRCHVDILDQSNGTYSYTCKPHQPTRPALIHVDTRVTPLQWTRVNIVDQQACHEDRWGSTSLHVVANPVLWRVRFWGCRFMTLDDVLRHTFYFRHSSAFGWGLQWWPMTKQIMFTWRLEIHIFIYLTTSFIY